MSDDRKESPNLLSPEVRTPEQEVNFETQETIPEQTPRAPEAAPVDQTQLSNLKQTAAAQAAAVPSIEKDPVLQEIESILSANLGEIYAQLPEDKREAFKLKGEEVASKIQSMITTAKIKVHEVLKMISAWLGMIPNVNVYFLRQEAKIKLDKVLDYADERSKNSV
jgi:DNA-directed RNA polymerase specialized sigma24 family protein